MAASYPNTIKTFTSKQNITSIVDAGDPNSLQDEVRAVELELGLTPRISTARSVTYADVKARLEAIETDYRLLTNHDSHAALGGLTGDDHTQYIKVDGTRAFTGTTAIAAAPGPVQAGDTQDGGTALTLARSDHRHAVSVAAGGASAVGDTAAAGTAQTLSRSDHRHSREGFGAVTAETSYGISAANGSATTVARSDHTHGSPSLTSTAPVVQAVGDAAAVGTGTDPARNDHRHGMPAFGSVTATTSFGMAAADGTAATVARSDHGHGTPALATTVTDERTWGIAPAVGVSTKAAKEDHTHGSPDPTLMGPTGTICMYPNDTPPSGWLLCNGASYLRTDYPALFTALGGASSPWGLPDGTHFNVPDLRGRVVVCDGQGTGLTNRTLASSGGAENVTLSLSQAPSHSHTVNSHSHGGGTGSGGVDHTHGYTTGGAGGHAHTLGNNAGGYAPFNIIFRYSGGSHGVPTNWTTSRTTLSGSTSPAHYHNTMDEANSSSWNVEASSIDTTGDHTHSGGTGGSSAYSHTHSVGAESPGTNSQGGGGSHSVMQPWIAMPFIIKS